MQTPNKTEFEIVLSHWVDAANLTELLYEYEVILTTALYLQSCNNNENKKPNTCKSFKSEHEELSRWLKTCNGLPEDLSQIPKYSLRGPLVS